MQPDRRIQDRLRARLSPQENQLILDCYHNDITDICTKQRLAKRLFRKMNATARYARRHSHRYADMRHGVLKLRVFRWRIPTDQNFSVPDAEGWANQ